MAKADIQDVSVIAEELRRFGRMSLEELKAHWGTHPEDRLPSLALPDRGHRPIGRKAAIRFAALADRLKRSDRREGHSLDLYDLERAVRESFVQLFMVEQRPVDERWIARMLTRAKKASSARHESITHYLPCVVLAETTPEEFQVGPVRFVTTEKFFLDNREKIDNDHRQRMEDLKKRHSSLPQVSLATDITAVASSSTKLDTLYLDRVQEYYGSYRWVAEVTVPRCDIRVSTERAETCIQAALDVLKIFLGPGRRWGADLRLGHSPARVEETASLKLGPDGAFRLSFTTGGEGAFVEKGWYGELKSDEYRLLDLAGAAIEGYLSPAIESAHRDRWLDALNWYGQAVSERMPSAQIVKFVASLERLTITSRTSKDDVTGRVTDRTALLTTDDPVVLASSREKARELYRWRSKLMHGRTSPLNREIVPALSLAYELVPRALLGALLWYYFLERNGKGKSADLESWFREREASLTPIGS